MSKKRLVYHGLTVKTCIEEALELIHLKQNQVVTRILQRDSVGLFGSKEAIVEILYDGVLSDQMALKKALNFSFLYSDNSIFISPHPSFFEQEELKDEKQREKMLKEFLEEKGFLNLYEEGIRTLIYATSIDDIIQEKESKGYIRDEGFVCIQQCDAEKLNEEGGSIYLEFLEDKMICKALIFHRGDITELDVFHALVQRGCCQGVSKNAIRKALRERSCDFFVIAQGKEPIDDKYEPVDLFFKTQEEAKKFEKEWYDDDLHFVEEKEKAEKGDLLIQMRGIEEGKDGYRVDGSPVERKKLSPKGGGIILGKHVFLSDDGLSVYAKEGGKIIWKLRERFIDVQDSYVVNGNVDFAEGDILDFPGKVIIHGDIKPAFVVTAEGDIEIHGSVENATVESKEGDVIVLQLINHASEGKVTAKGTVYASLINHANITAGRIVIEKEVLSSNLESSSEILVTGSPGTIIAGQTTARLWLYASILGSANGIETKIIVGDVRHLNVECEELPRSISVQKNIGEETENILSILQAKKDSGELSRKQAKHFSENQEKLQATKEKIEELEKRLEYVRRELEERRKAKLEVMKTIYSQTHLYFYDINKEIPKERSGYSLFCVKNGKVKTYRDDKL